MENSFSFLFHRQQLQSHKFWQMIKNAQCFDNSPQCLWPTFTYSYGKSNRLTQSWDRLTRSWHSTLSSVCETSSLKIFGIAEIKNGLPQVFEGKALRNEETEEAIYLFTVTIWLFLKYPVDLFIHTVDEPTDIHYYNNCIFFVALKGDRTTYFIIYFYRKYLIGIPR